MAKNPTRFAEQATEEAMQGTMQGTIYGMNWMREIAEQNLDQTRMLLENLLAITRKAIDDIDHQSSEFHQRSLLVAKRRSPIPSILCTSWFARGNHGSSLNFRLNSPVGKLKQS